MPDARGPTALLRHAAQQDDRPLAALIASRLAGEGGAVDPIAVRAYRALIQILHLRCDPRDYHHG